MKPREIQVEEKRLRNHDLPDGRGIEAIVLPAFQRRVQPSELQSASYQCIRGFMARSRID